MGPEGICQSCGSQGMEVFYEVGAVPVHSVLLMPTQRQALACRRGDIALAVCCRCGFVGNLRFDAGLHEYSERYEETQGFSATFSAFHRELARHLVERYDLRGKTVLEIGCGKGEFLEMLCELGDNRGVGFDPAYVPGRNPAAASGRTRYVQDYYSEKYAACRADLVCCKMTLEHIQETAQFAGILRRALDDQPQTAVFFMVPDAGPALRQAMFWDIYYEHCSYFTAPSLAHLFRSCGFDVLDVQRVYGDQYLALEARPASRWRPAPLPVPEGVEDVLADVATFARQCPGRLEEWKARLQGLRRDGRRTVLWGASSRSVSFLTTVQAPGAVDCVVDINPYKHGTFMPGTGEQIVGPEHLRQYRPDVVIAMNPIYREEIGRDLSRMGLAPQLLVV
ncbi:MAG: class I SAM-dependent methyltransferase [Candidatus Latescibacterota bacterium]